MILYHGTPMTPAPALAALAGHRFCVSFPDPRDVTRCHAIGTGVMLDNGAFSAWRRGIANNWAGFYAWACDWLHMAATTWAVIPDVIAGDEATNDALLAQWPHGDRGAPVWHLHESLGRLIRLIETWPRVCIGSSAEYAVVMSPRWQQRMDETWNAIIRAFGLIPNLHMLRGIQLAGRRWPFASADSTDIARNHNRPHNTPLGMALRWERRASRTARTWEIRPIQSEMFA